MRCVVKFDMLDPVFEKVSALRFIAPEADAAESPESSSVSFGYSPNKGFEVTIPGNNDRGESVTDGRDYGVGRTGREQIADESYIMTA